MNGSKRIEIAIELKPVADELLQRFREKFGRNPGPLDPLFFDPDSDHPVALSQAKLDRVWNLLVDTWLQRREITPEIAYAMKKTGRIISEENRPLSSKEELAQWNEALNEYAQATSDKHSKKGVTECVRGCQRTVGVKATRP